jgi:hypothetical protein
MEETLVAYSMLQHGKTYEQASSGIRRALVPKIAGGILVQDAVTLRISLAYVGPSMGSRQPTIVLPQNPPPSTPGSEGGDDPEPDL